MIDATSNIIDAIEYLLIDINYNGTKFPVLDTLPKAKVFNHIWIKGISATDEGTKDKEIQSIKIDLEVVKSGSAQKGNLNAVNDISSQISRIMKNLTLNGFYIIIPPRLITYSFIDEIVQAENQQIIVDRKLMTFDMLIQES